MSTTMDAALGTTGVRGGLALRLAVVGCIGFVAGYGIAMLRVGAAPAAATPLALAGHAVSEAKLARRTAAHRHRDRPACRCRAGRRGPSWQP